MQNHVARAGMLEKMFYLMGGSKTKEPKDFCPGARKFRTKIVGKLKALVGRRRSLACAGKIGRIILSIWASLPRSKFNE
jgi:hypothetical protein